MNRRNAIKGCVSVLVFGAIGRALASTQGGTSTKPANPAQSKQNASLKKYKVDYAKPGNLQEKLDIMAEYLELKDPA